jgi:hypothetical protein
MEAITYATPCNLGDAMRFMRHLKKLPIQWLKAALRMAVTATML